MTIKLKDLKQRVAGFHKKAAELNPTDPTEKGTVSAPKNDAVDPKIPNPENKVAPQATAGMETKPTTSDVNAKTPKDGNQEDKQTKSASGVDNAIAKLKSLSKKAKTAEASAPGAAAPTPQDAPKQEQISFGPDSLMKLAAAIFETQEGVDAVLPVLRKKAGQEAAISLLKQASDEYEAQVAHYNHMQKLAYAQEQELIQAEAFIADIVKSASSPEEADRLIKTAAQHASNRNALGDELLKAAYDQSVEDAAEMVAAEEAGGEPALEGADGEPTIEQILMLLEQAVAAGEISEDDAIMIAQALMGGEGAAPAGEDISEEEAAAMAAQMPKEASTNRVKDILNYLNK